MTNKLKTTEVTTAGPANPLTLILSEPEKINQLDTGKLKELMDLQERILDREASAAFALSFNKVQAEMRPVVRAAKNTHTASMYAKAEHVKQMLDPILTRHGFSYSVSTEQSGLENHTRFVLLLRHTGGHSERHYMDAPIDNVGIKGSPTKTRLHGMASSYTACERHLLCKVFGVQLVDDDDGNRAAGVGNSVELITADQAANLDAMLDEVGGNRNKFFSFLQQRIGVSKIADIPANRFNEIVNLLEAKRQAGGQS